MPDSQEIQVPKYRPAETLQATFNGGLNATDVDHALAANEVQSSTNVDMSQEWGAAPCRRGSVVLGSGTSTNPGFVITRNYAVNTSANFTDPDIPWYVGDYTGNWFTGSGAYPITLVPLSSGGGVSGLYPVWTQYESYTYLANGTSAIRTNGTNTFNWILPAGDSLSTIML